ncbi:hypothetical protein RHMOL_Rhmol07G0203500 [Rhododendron molle]|uniref:Uncharacterized protein n=1 Tax=Rhododendron molle TaxID=49168 RepID=A0ACC0N2J1_RHOML|nr:hypothetical protein RHMOL_Rhmol07G0203500 [Rhododendron molle]
MPSYCSALISVFPSFVNCSAGLTLTIMSWEYMKPKRDEVVAYHHGEKSAQTLSSAGFQNLTFRSYNGLGHYTIPQETDEVCHWLTARLVLEGSGS